MGVFLNAPQRSRLLGQRGRTLADVCPVYPVTVQMRQATSPATILVAPPMHPSAEPVEQQVFNADYQHAQPVDAYVGPRRILARQSRRGRRLEQQVS